MYINTAAAVQKKMIYKNMKNQTNRKSAVTVAHSQRAVDASEAAAEDHEEMTTNDQESNTMPRYRIDSLAGSLLFVDTTTHQPARRNH
jgi:DNA-binding transcriptional regulator WhiA